MKLLMTFIAGLLLSNVALADIDESLDQMCSKIKTCSLESAGAADMPPEMQTMMLNMFDGVCKSILQPYYASIGQAGLEGKAEACMDTFLGASCEVLLENNGEYTSPECEEFKKAADNAGVDIGQ